MRGRIARTAAAALCALAASGCGRVEDPACWEGTAEALVLPLVQPGSPQRLEARLVNRCDRELAVLRAVLVPVACEGACPELALVELPALPYFVKAGGSFPVALQSSAAVADGSGTARALLSVHTGHPPEPAAVQVWDVEGRYDFSPR